jgi:parallel beta-helix repeat protein
MNSRAIIVLAGTVFGILAALLLASPLSFGQACTRTVNTVAELVGALNNDGNDDAQPGNVICIGGAGDPYTSSTLAVAVSGTAAKPITVCGGNAACGDLNDSFGLPTVTLTTSASANLVNITGSNIIFRDLELNPASGAGNIVPIGVNVTGSNVTLANLRLLFPDLGNPDYTTAAIKLDGASGRASGNRVEGTAADCIQVTAGTYTVEGNTLRQCGDSSGENGIEITSGSGHTIAGNTIFSAADVGIFVDSRSTVQNNVIDGDGDTETGIHLAGNSDDSVVQNNTIFGIAIGGGNEAINVFAGADRVRILNNNLRDVGFLAPLAEDVEGIFIGDGGDANDVEATGNIIFVSGGGNGIEASGSASARGLLMNNQITKDEGSGILLGAVANEWRITGNTIRAKDFDGDGSLATGDGIQVASSANIIRDNDIDLDNPDVAGDQRTGAHGINVSGNDNQILGNHVQRVGGNGVNITGTRNRVDSGSACLIENNAGHGVAISSSGNNFVFNCTIRNNLGDGVNVAKADNLIQGNTITGNTGDGVELNGDSADNNVVGVGGPNPAATQANTITGNGESGVEVNNGDENLIKGNTISGNALNQVLLNNTATKNTVKENTITAASDGIVVNSDSDDNNTIEKNTISGDAGSTGIRITNADGIIVKDNTLTGPGATVAGTGIRNTGGGEAANRNKFTGNKIKNWSIGMQWDGTYVAHAYNCNVFQDNATGVRITGTGTGNELNFQDVVAFDPAATQGNDFINNTTAHIDHQGTLTVDGQNNFFVGAFAGTLPAGSLVVFGPGDGSAFGFVVGGGAAALQLKRTGTSCSGFTPPGGGGGGGGGGSAPKLGDVNLNDSFEQGDLDELLNALRNRASWLTDPSDSKFQVSDVARPCGKITRADYNRLRSSLLRVQKGRSAFKSQCGSKGTIGFDPASAPRLLTVLSGQAGAAGVRVAIYDFAGRLLLEQKATGAQVALDLVQRELANGVYLAVVESLAADGRTLVREVRKVIVLR